MQSAREPGLGRARAASAPRVPATNRTLVWFGGEAERRRHVSAGAQEAVPGGVARRSAGWQRLEIFGCAALAALAVAALPSLNAVGMRPCLTQPLVLTPGADLDVKMTVSPKAACTISAKANGITVNDVTITAAPLHGTIAQRGRTGVTYRPTGRSGSEDFFAFAIRGTQDRRDQVSLFRVHVTIN
jgi:hypothetical protein